jgi:hypothetical protein
MSVHSNCYQDLLPIPNEWEDVSYSNDVCSSFYREDISMALFINPLNKEDREDESLLRFTLVPTDYDGCEYEWHKAITFDDISNIRIGLTHDLLWNNYDPQQGLTPTWEDC